MLWCCAAAAAGGGSTASEQCALTASDASGCGCCSGCLTISCALGGLALRLLISTWLGVHVLGTSAEQSRELVSELACSSDRLRLAMIDCTRPSIWRRLLQQQAVAAARLLRVAVAVGPDRQSQSDLQHQQEQ
jgi:hypothetical protein